VPLTQQSHYWATAPYRVLLPAFYSLLPLQPRCAGAPHAAKLLPHILSVHFTVRRRLLRDAGCILPLFFATYAGVALRLAALLCPARRFWAVG